MHEDFIQGLRNARLLLERGWTQRDFMRSNKNGVPCYCLAGALRASGVWPSSYSVVMPGRKRPLKRSESSLTRWNDAPERTRGQVLACIDNSIAALEAN